MKTLRGGLFASCGRFSPNLQQISGPFGPLPGPPERLGPLASATQRRPPVCYSPVGQGWWAGFRQETPPVHLPTVLPTKNVHDMYLAARTIPVNEAAHDWMCFCADFCPIVTMVFLKSWVMATCNSKNPFASSTCRKNWTSKPAWRTKHKRMMG